MVGYVLAASYSIGLLKLKFLSILKQYWKYLKLAYELYLSKA